MPRKQLKIFTLAIALTLILILIYSCDWKCFLVYKTYFLSFGSEYALWESKDINDIDVQIFEGEAGVKNKSNLPWFTKYGEVEPSVSSTSASSLLPDPKNPFDDRTSLQLLYKPPSYGEDSPSKLVLMHDFIGNWLPHDEGPSPFQSCPINKCVLTTKKERMAEADAVIFGEQEFAKPLQPKSKNQVWIIYMLESPANTKMIYPSHMFNWTMTYRPDSDIPSPYGTWFNYGDRRVLRKPLRNFAANKTLKVAWFVSNCKAKNLRYEYAAKLAEYIDVDIFGKCGDKSCPRASEEQCNKLLQKNYKFYLAFENSNCNYYITEKFFRTALRHNVIPIVMGARRADYAHFGPEGSFIHVEDFQSPEELASYLHKIDQDDELFNSYFLWQGTGEFINNYNFCRLCTLLHSQVPAKHYPNINQWWRRNHVCENGS